MSIESLTPESFFPELASFEHKEMFSSINKPWEIIGKINPYIIDNFPEGWAKNVLPVGVEAHELPGEEMLYCTHTVVLEHELVCPSIMVRIGEGTKIEPGAVIKGPAIIGKNCDIRQTAYLRGNMITGDVCTLGHATEIKNSILMNHTEAGHFNYIGDCVLGSYVNLGAGTRLANLNFRTPEQKKAVAFPEITFRHDGKKIKTGVSKFGAIIGDYCETGCNAVTNPAVMLGPDSRVFPNTNVPPGYYPAKSVIKP
ncbi:MAG: glucose-1-phosphate thymidylyltransferase [Nitrospinota bacterium]